jgi:hypothetical protein
MTGNGRYRVNSDEIAARVVDGEAILINLSNGTYYSIEGTGAIVWALLERGHPVADVAAELSRRLGVDEQTALEDVERLVARLVEERILVAAEQTATPGPIDGLPYPPAYATPHLEKYEDMSDLLALDPPMPGLTDIPWQAPGT